MYMYFKIFPITAYVCDVLAMRLTDRHFASQQAEFVLDPGSDWQPM